MMTPKELLEGMKEIYDNEINIKISTFWDAGYAITIGNETDGYKMDGYSTIEEAMEALIKEHRKRKKVNA